MQVGDGAVAADEQPAPDQRADPAQDEPQLVDDRGSGLKKLRHAAIMARVLPSPVAPPLVLSALVQRLAGLASKLLDELEARGAE
jgi:hypothetical protein